MGSREALASASARGLNWSPAMVHSIRPSQSMTAEEALRLRDLLFERSQGQVVTRRDVLEALDLRRSDIANLPEAAFLPEPRRDLGRTPADRALSVDRDNNRISTSDGYRVE